MQITNFLLLAGALGAVAHPSGHAHLHRSAEGKRDVFVKNIHRQPIPKPAPPPPKPSSTTSATPEPTLPSLGDLINEFIPFCSGGGAASRKSKRVTEAQVMYTGNLGTDGGCPWGSNLMAVADSLIGKYQYTQKYTNVADVPYQVVCGNKMGADRQLTGMFKVPGQKQLIFTLAPGESRTVVADSNTQGVCAFAPNEVPLTDDGQFAGVWAEFDVGSDVNKGWSGADCSSLVAQAYKMDVPGCKISHSGVDSIILPGGKGDNAYTIGMEKLDGIGLNVIPGAVHFEVAVGFSG